VPQTPENFNWLFLGQEIGLTESKQRLVYFNAPVVVLLKM
jgi:hypothetical protein